MLHTERNYDVVISGGGTAGIAAALASARHGAKTLLLEKEYALGGLATLGLIVIYLPLCDGEGVQMSGGICEELIKLSTGCSPVELPTAWADPCASREERAKTRYRVTYNAASFMILAEKLLLQHSVDILYDSRVIGAETSGGSVRSLRVATKTGDMTVSAKAFVDCTGDADVCYFAGEETLDNPNNVRTGWYFSSGSDGVKLHILSDKLYFNAPPEGMPLYGGTDPDDISRHMFDMHSFILDDAEKRRETDPSYQPLIIPAFHGLRMTRRLSGVFEFSETEHERVWFDDAIGMIGNWKHPGKRYCIPMRCIKAKVNGNLYAAGRCASGDELGWDLLRVIPTCAVTGEAAGTAAAMQALSGSMPGIRDIQCELTKAGVPLDRSLFTRFE